jgi:Sulfotransferase domain.
VGEGSTGYLRSQVAVPAILRQFPRARFIVCVRNPADMAISLHSHLLRMAVEDQPDFQRAWDLQEARRAGRNIPRLCSEPRSLLYSEVCALGSQLERLYRQVPASQVLVLDLSELAADPAACYRRALAFLGLPDDGRSTFRWKTPVAVCRAGWCC